MTFKDDLLTDAKNVFLGGNDEFDEEITYTPSGESGKTINALVVRDVLEPGKENSRRSLKNQAEVYIANDATAGVTAIDRAGDSIAVADREGNSKDARVAKVIGNDGGMWHLLVEWGGV